MVARTHSPGPGGSTPNQPRLGADAEWAQQARALAATLVVVEQETRDRVAHMLHDALQQQLYSIQMRLGAVQERLDQGEIDEATRLIGTQRRRLGEAIEIARDLTLDLSPPLDNNDGLIEWLSWLAAHMFELQGLRVHVDAGAAEVDVADPTMRVLVFEAVRELLFNITKHAGTDEATISVEQSDDRVFVWVHDDGEGFDPERVEPSHDRRSGLGLSGMRERLRLVGGDVDIATRPHVGTTVTVHVPLSSA